MEARNRMSAAALKASENANIEFINNPKTGKMFFSCGSKTGYISPRVKEAHQNGTLTTEQMDYCECSIDGTEYVPCLMIHADNSKNVVGKY